MIRRFLHHLTSPLFPRGRGNISTTISGNTWNASTVERFPPLLFQRQNQLPSFDSRKAKSESVLQTSSGHKSMSQWQTRDTFHMFFFTKRKVRWVFKVTALWWVAFCTMHLWSWYGNDLTQEQVVETAQLLKENHERGDPILIGFCQKWWESKRVAGKSRWWTIYYISLDSIVFWTCSPTSSSGKGRLIRIPYNSLTATGRGHSQIILSYYT